MKLETREDKHKEQLIIRRLFVDDPTCQWIPCTDFAAVDYIGVREGEVVKVAEIKTRKQSKAEVQQYPGGLILKRRKYDELIQVERLLNVPTYVFFGFSNGTGHILASRPAALPKKPDVDIGRRDRELATDLEPVVLLDWDVDLIPWLEPMESGL